MAEKKTETPVARGIRLPVSIKHGRIALVSGDEYIRQLMVVAFGDCESDNPFEDLGLGEGMIFGVNDSMTEGEIIARIEMIMEDFAENGLASLIPSDPPTFEKREGELFMELPYINLETQESDVLDLPIPSGANS